MNKLLVAAQKTKDNGIKFVKGTFGFRESVLLSVTDASHAAETVVTENGAVQGHRSQGGRFLLLADRMPTEETPTHFHILEWQSHTLKRVCRSTLQAEVLSSMAGSESGQQVRSLMYSLQHPMIPGDRGLQWKIEAADYKTIYWMSDCKSFIDYMSAVTPNTVSDKRLAIDMTSLRQELWREFGSEVGDPASTSNMPKNAQDQLWWICTADMISDELTKSMKWDAVREICESGQWKLSVKPIRAGFQSIKDIGVSECSHNM